MRCCGHKPPFSLVKMLVLCSSWTASVPCPLLLFSKGGFFFEDFGHE